MERSNESEDQLPPGFRFHPTDEELIVFYLRNQASSKPCPSSIISPIDIYKFDPWELPGKAEYGESEWYFFSRRDRKYPNGVRPNRATVSGYWKATGTDKAIYSKTKYVGVKKSLVFYKGKPPKGIKTSWIMHEYRLAESTKHPNRQIESMRLEDWVLCRIYKKRQIVKQYEAEVDDLPAKNAMDDAYEASDQQMLKLPRTFSINHQLGLDYLGSISISHLLDDNSFNSSLGGPLLFSPLSKMGKESSLLPVSSPSERYYIGSLIVILVSSWIIIHRWSQRKKKGPKTWPFVGAAIEQLRNYDRMHDWLVEYLSKSNTVAVPMPFCTYTYIADPANVEHILKTNFANYPKGQVYHSYMEVLLGDGIFNVDGELWRKQRKTASFEFASKNLRDFSTVVFREYSLKLSAILNQSSRNNQAVDMQVNPYSMGRMEYNWGPDASSFNPERWLKDGSFQNASPFKFTAFQAGPRICLGKDSAYLQMKMALAILCRFYKFHLVPGHLTLPIWTT